jgi:hypothetical protein
VQVSGMRFEGTEGKSCTIEFVSTPGTDGAKIGQLELFLNGQHFTARRQ